MRLRRAGTYLGQISAVGCFFAFLSVASADEQSVYEHWLDVPQAQRCPRMFADLGVAPRRLHLPSAVVRFLDIPAAEPDEGPPWLLIHGYAGNLCDHGPMVARLARRHRVLAFDLPGFGESASEDEQYTIDSYVQTLREFLDRVEAGPVHLVCHSLGGHVCIGAALGQPRYIETLTLIDTAGIFEKSGFVKQIAKHKGGLNLGRMVVQRGRSLVDWTDGDHAFLRRFVVVNPTIWTAVASFRSNYRGQMRAIRTPTLILWGMEDPLFPVEDSGFLIENVPGARLHVIDGAGHCPNESHAGMVVELIERFVRERKSQPP
jgi:2-hydroxy-6-oxonona-2,4-dienedioate hydrolase